MNSVPLKTKVLLRYQCGCYSNIVTITIEYWLVLIIPRKLCVKMNLISLSTKELLRYHCCCHGNIVTIATVYVADACYLTLQLHKERLETS